MPVFSANCLSSLLAGQLRPGRLWIAYSGGCDSAVLLHACAYLRDTLDLDLSLNALHIDHGLHPRSADWARHCRRVCDQLGVAYHERQARIERCPGESLEALARAARQRLFADCLEPGDWLATAQHRDDQAETLLLALLRGSGVHGLAAMPTRAPLGAGVLVRPLLGFERTDLRAYAERHRLQWIDDPSNTDLGFDRNRLRHQVMPLLRQRWPAAAATIARSAAQAAEAAALIDAMADERLPGLAGSRSSALSITRLSALEPAHQRAILRRWLARQGFRLPSAARLEAVLHDLLPARADAVPLIAWDGCELRRYRDDLFALAPLPPSPDPALALCWEGERPLRLPAGLGWLSLEVVDSVPAAPMTLCFGRRGLRCRRANRPSRTLKPLFQEAGIPAWLRPYVPLLLDAQGELIAVAGVAGCGGTHNPPVRGLRWEGHPWAHFGWFAEFTELF